MPAAGHGSSVTSGASGGTRFSTAIPTSQWESESFARPHPSYIPSQIPRSLPAPRLQAHPQLSSPRQDNPIASNIIRTSPTTSPSNPDETPDLHSTHRPRRPQRQPRNPCSRRRFIQIDQELSMVLIHKNIDLNLPQRAHDLGTPDLGLVRRDQDAIDDGAVGGLGDAVPGR